MHVCVHVHTHVNMEVNTDLETYYARTTWMNLEDIMLSEIRKGSENKTLHDLAYLCVDSKKH